MGVSRLSLALLACTALICGCKVSNEDQNQTDGTNNTENNTASASIPSWKCPPNLSQAKCPVAWFEYQKHNVIVDFEAAQDLENGISNVFQENNTSDGAQLENDVAVQMHHSQPTWLYEQDQLRDAGVPFSASDTLSQCLNAIDTMQGLVVYASDDRTQSNLEASEKSRLEYVAEARKCEHGFHLEPMSSTLRSRKITFVDDPAPST